MRRFRPAIVVAMAMMAAASGAAGCGRSSTPTEPTLGSVNFAPKLVVTIDDRGLSYARGPREDPAVTTDPPFVPSGSVLDVVNHAARDRRLQGGTSFDTGIMHPGESTTVVVVGGTDGNTTIPLTDPDDASVTGSLSVGPKPAT